MGKGSSNAGRPRKDGERYPSGQLKPQKVAPNERVVAERRALLGADDLDVATASDPLDFALARNFLTLARYRAALAFAEVYGRTGMGGPRMSTGGPVEATTTVAADERLRSHVGAKNQWQTMTRAQIASVFDAVFSVTAGPADTEQRQVAAMQRWKDLIAPLTPDERSELMVVCVHRSWPQWIVWMARGKDVPPIWDRKRALLETGLDKVAETLRGLWKAGRDLPAIDGRLAEIPAIAGIAGASEDAEISASAPRGLKVSETTRYVTPDGELIREVVIRRRRLEHRDKVVARLEAGDYDLAESKD